MSLCSRVLAGPCHKRKEGFPQMERGLSVILYLSASCSKKICQWSAITSDVCKGWGKGNSRGDFNRAEKK